MNSPGILKEELMDDILMRNQAPVSAEEWQSIDQTVVEVARKVLVGRRFIPMAGPLGLGAQYITTDRLPVSEKAPVAVDLSSRRVVPLATLEKDFNLLWQDLATAKQTGSPLDVGPIAVATVMVTQQEDALIFNGSRQAEGLLTAKGHLTGAFGNWDDPLAAIAAVAAAVGAMMNQGLQGPFALAVNPVTYAKLLKPVDGNHLALKLMGEIATAGVFQTPVLTENQAVVVSNGRENLELVVGQDLTAAYLGPVGMDHSFRVLETLALRIRRPVAIAVLS
jgi:uncharacterized linocin/CFP29 family protein